MNIKELIASTNKVPNRDEASVFRKKFGSIYAYNKNITVLSGGNVIAINMIIGGVTDMIKIGGKRKPVAYHKVSLALRIGKDAKKDFTAEELVQNIRARFPKYRSEEEWPPQDVIQEVMKNPDQFFEDSTVFKTTNKGVGYTVISNNIPDDCEIQVWCSCSDYYWTFQYYNMATHNKSGASVNLYGDTNYPKTYNHRSEAGKKSKRPLRNPGRHPGMCKHLMLLLAMLMKDDIVKDPKTGLTKYFKANYNEFIKGKEKSRVNWDLYMRRLAQYKKDHDILNEQRNSHLYSTGSKQQKTFWQRGGRNRWMK